MRACPFPVDMGCWALKSIPPRFSAFQRCVSCFPVSGSTLVLVDRGWSLLALVFFESLDSQAHVVGQVQIDFSSPAVFLMPFEAALNSVP